MKNKLSAAGLSPFWRRLLRGGRRNDADRIAGDAARNLGDWRSAVDHYQRYMARYPDHKAVALRLGNMLKEAHDYVAAEELFNDWLRRDPEDVETLRLRGELEVHRGRPEAGARFFARSWTLGRDRVSGEALTRPDALPVLAELQKQEFAPIVDGAVDGLRDLAIDGWAFDPASPDRSIEVILTAGGVELARTATGRAREELAQLGLAPLTSGFRFEIGALLGTGRLSGDLRILFADSGRELAGSPLDMTATAGIVRWLTRPQARSSFVEQSPPVISILMPVHDVRFDWLEEALISVLNQGDPRWELICVDDGSTMLAVRMTLSRFAARDARIQLVTHANAKGIAAATNTALSLARADHVLFMDHDDRLEPEAVARLAEHLGAADLLYGDEAITGEDIADLRALVARPAFSRHYYLSHPYFVHPVAMRRALVSQLGGLDETLAISADVDLILRLIEKAESVVHLPGLLYRWRTHRGSSGHARSTQAVVATVQALNRHFSRIGEDATASPGPVFNTYRIDRRDPGGRVRVIIPTHNGVELLRACITSLRSTAPIHDLDIVIIDHDSDDPALSAYLRELGDIVTIRQYSGPFNYSRMNNLAVADQPAGGEFLLFMNNDVAAIEPGWLERLRALAALPEVGAVGATLLYPDGRIQHAGVIVGPGGYAEHAFKFTPYNSAGARNPGYNCSLTATRDWSAVTGACLMMRRDVFDMVRGFDESLPVGFNDTDLCLRLKERGLAVLNDGLSVLTHHESATRRPAGEVRHPEDAARFAARWKSVIETGDPFYSPLLSLDRDHAPDHPDVVDAAPRTTSIRRSPAHG